MDKSTESSLVPLIQLNESKIFKYPWTKESQTNTTSLKSEKPSDCLKTKQFTKHQRHLGLNPACPTHIHQRTSQEASRLRIASLILSDGTFFSPLFLLAALSASSAVHRTSSGNASAVTNCSPFNGPNAKSLNLE